MALTNKQLMTEAFLRAMTQANPFKPPEVKRDPPPEPKAPPARQYRQGDVLIEAVDQIPEDAKPRATPDRVVLAYGEVTGHAHAIYGSRVAYFAFDESRVGQAHDGGTAYLDVPEPVEVKHEEHAPIALEPGKYRVQRQRQFSEEAQRKAEWVAD